jgi:hypothetical protein
MEAQKLPSSNFNFPLLLILSSVDTSHGLEFALEARMCKKRKVLLKLQKVKARAFLVDGFGKGKIKYLFFISRLM